MIIDIRNRLAGPITEALEPLLVDKPAQFAAVTQPDFSTPGAFHWSELRRLDSKANRYRGKIAILVDENTQAEGEYAAMAFRTASGAVVVGSKTAGAAGHTLEISLPGGVHASIGAEGVFNPDKTPVQGAGIAIDLSVRPTIEGVRSGRDEVLEAALHEILGPDLRR